MDRGGGWGATRVWRAALLTAVDGHKGNAELAGDLAAVVDGGHDNQADLGRRREKVNRRASRAARGWRSTKENRAHHEKGAKAAKAVGCVEEAAVADVARRTAWAMVREKGRKG